MNPVLASFIYGDARPAKAELEAAAFEDAPHLTTQERNEANDALLRKLDFAKKAAGPHTQHKQLLADPYISDLANTLLILNTPWIVRTIGGSRKHLRLRDTSEELFSLAAMGDRSAQADVGGAYGVILSYDYDRIGDASALTQCLQTGIRRAFLPNHKDARKNHVEVLMNGEAEEAFARCRDHRERNPAAIALDNDLLDAIRVAIRKMPEKRREAASFIFDRLLETGEMPTQEEVASRFTQKADGVPASRARGGQIVQDVMTRLTANLKEICPQLDEIGGWREIKAAFRKTNEQGAYR